MSDLKFTPGPWSYQPGTLLQGFHYEGNPLQIVAENGCYVGKVDAVERGAYDEAQNEANARLIVAAPDLYEALKANVANFDAWAERETVKAGLLDMANGLPYHETSCPSEPKCIVMARAALAKVEGGIP